MIVGIIWISLVFVATEKAHDEIILKQSSSLELESEFTGVDIGFYKVYMPKFAGEDMVFVQILDPKDNVIQEQKIQTKLSVGYFDFDGDGTYAIKIVNITEDQINLQVEFGNTNSQEMIPAGILIVVGAVTIIVMAYLKIKNYNMAQPDENIS